LIHGWFREEYLSYALGVELITACALMDDVKTGNIEYWKRYLPAVTAETLKGEAERLISKGREALEKYDPKFRWRDLLKWVIGLSTD
jgi:hypothetical protein